MRVSVDQVVVCVAWGSSVRCVLKPFLIAASFFSLTWNAAHARDPAAFNWTGMYVGVNLGGAWGESEFTHTATGQFVADPPSQPNLAAFGSGALQSRGVIGGVQAGYNWQVGSIVVGFESDMQAWASSASSQRGPQVYFPGPPPPPATAAFSQTVNSDYLFTLRSRVGLALDGALVYVTGGLAVTKVKFSQAVLFGPFPEMASGSVSETKLGWTLGGGAEFVLTRNWTVKAEYLYVQFDDVTARLFNPTSPMYTHEVQSELSAQIVRVGVNYKF